MDNLTELYCLMDGFCKNFTPQMNKYLLAQGKCRQQPTRISQASACALHQLRFRQFKTFYPGYVCCHLRSEFPTLPSYSRCVGLLPRCALALAALAAYEETR